MNQPSSQPSPANDIPPNGDKPFENPEHEPMVEPDGDPTMDPIRDDPADVVEASSKQTSARDEAEDSTQKTTPQAGEGSYEGTRDYAKSMADYTKHAETHGGVAAVVEADARAAAPKTSAEAKEMGRAEKEAASRTRAPGK